MYNEIIKIEDKEAMVMMNRIGAEEGLHVGKTCTSTELGKSLEEVLGQVR